MVGSSDIPMSIDFLNFPLDSTFLMGYSIASSLNVDYLAVRRQAPNGESFLDNSEDY